MIKHADTKHAAAYWASKLVGDDVGPADRAAFEAWLNENPENEAAFSRTQRALRLIDQNLNDPMLQELSSDVMRETGARQGANMRPAMMAASFIFLVCFGALVFGLVQSAGPSFEAMPSAELHRATYETQIGERLTVTLDDGSIVTLNTDSKLSVDMSGPSRMLNLLRGQALFDVEKDPARPFIVQAGNRRITAIGTEFDVRLHSDNRVKVVLVEGKVAVDELFRYAGGDLFSVIPKRRVELAHGQQLIAARESPLIRENIDTNDAISWSKGLLVFRGHSLPEAIDEVNRYTKDKLVLAEDKQLHALTVNGVFHAGRSESFVSALKTVHDIESQRNTNGEIELVWRE